MNQVEEIFLMAMNVEDKAEKLRLLAELYGKGKRILKLQKKTGGDVENLDKALEDFRVFIEKL